MINQLPNITPSQKRVMKETTAYLMNDLLRSVVILPGQEQERSLETGIFAARPGPLLLIRISTAIEPVIRMPGLPAIVPNTSAWYGWDMMKIPIKIIICAKSMAAVTDNNLEAGYDCGS
jgi:hypothetical protein